MQKQNDLLHEQIENLSSKLAASVKQAAQGTLLDLSLTEEGKSQDQILEILRLMALLNLLYLFSRHYYER